MTIEKPERFKAVVEVSTGHTRACSICHGTFERYDGFQEKVNHYLDHGLTLLHVGMRHEFDSESPTAHTVAILGSEQPLPDPPKVVIGGVEY